MRKGRTPRCALAAAAGLVFICALAPAYGIAAAHAAETAAGGCRRTSGPTVAADGDAFDAPGGARIGVLSPGARYIRVTTLRHTDGEPWMLLSGPGGVHVGWIMAKAVKSTDLGGLSCPVGDLYGQPR